MVTTIYSSYIFSISKSKLELGQIHTLILNHNLHFPLTSLNLLLWSDGPKRISRSLKLQFVWAILFLQNLNL